jgi:N-acetylglucosaminyl-diphospho-decaprenol L-rhamnosyltransferase
VTAEPAPTTIAIVSWNTREHLARCLESMRPDAEAGLARVVVIDNGSEDGSPEMVRRDHGWAQLIESGANLGFGPAVNRVAAESEGSWIAASNADIELTPGALTALVRRAESDPAIGAVAPRLIVNDGSTQPSVHRFPSPSQATLFATGAYRVVPGLGERMCLQGYWDVEQPRPIDWAHGAFLLIRRSAFEAVGGFDESQWMYAEDAEIAWRLREAGYSVFYEPAARVHHAVSAATIQAFGQFDRHRREYEASYRWLATRRGRRVAKLTAAIAVAGELIRLAALAPLARIARSRWEPARARTRVYLALHRIGLSAGDEPAPKSESA